MFNTKKAIRIALAVHDIEQSDLAKASGLAPSAVSSLKRNGNPTVSTLVRLSDALNIQLSEFISYGE